MNSQEECIYFRNMFFAIFLISLKLIHIYCRHKNVIRRINLLSILLSHYISYMQSEVNVFLYFVNYSV